MRQMKVEEKALRGYRRRLLLDCLMADQHEKMVEVDAMLEEYKGRYQLLFEKFAPSPQPSGAEGGRSMTHAEKSAQMKASFADMSTELDTMFEAEEEGKMRGRERSGSFVMDEEEGEGEQEHGALIAMVANTKEEKAEMEGHGAATQKQEEEETMGEDDDDGTSDEDTDGDMSDEDEGHDVKDGTDVSDLELSEMQEKLLIGRLGGKRVLKMLAELTGTRERNVEMQAEMDRLQRRDREMKDNLDLLRVSLEGSGVNKELQKLITTLTNQLRDKEEALQMMIADKAILAARIKELEEVYTK
jgi:hypothetical protein